MNITIQTQPDAINITVQTSDTSAVCFVVNGNTPEAVTDGHGNIIGYTSSPEHALLYADFQQSEQRLLKFCELLAENASTAFSQYLAIRDAL